MPVTLRSLSNLNADNVVQQIAETMTRIQEDNPHLDLKRGPLFGVLAYYHALLAEQRAAEIADYNTGRSLLLMQAVPEGAGTDLVDDILSNFRVSRQLGAFATGQITLLFTTNVTVTIGVGSVFQADGKRFIAVDTFTGKGESGQINSSTDRVLTPTDDGKFALVIDAIAEAVGVENEIKKDTTVVPLVLPNNFVSAFATNDFIGGRATETNSDLLQRFQVGVAAKATSNRVNMEALLRDEDDFSSIVRMSIIGFGDAEMLRDQHAIWPGSLGGRVDWYIRTMEQVYRRSITPTATLVEINDDGYGVWQFSLGADVAPGFYEIANVRPLNAVNTVSPFDVVFDERGYDVSGAGERYIPDVVNVEETAFTRYQTATIRFVDQSRANTYSVGDTRQVQCEARGMPLLAEIQDFVNRRDIRSYGADLLVKAPIPCFVKLHFTLARDFGLPDPDLTGLNEALCRSVNTTGFQGRLFASQLYDVMQSYLPAGINANTIDMFGRLRYPDGSTHYVRSSEVLQPETAFEKMVSPRTVQFFLSPEDVSISLITTEALNI